MIRLANTKDLENIMKIISVIQKELQEEQNFQWSIDFDDPNSNDFLNDIKEKSLYILEEENQIKGFLTIQLDKKEYVDFIKTTEEKAYVLHRLAVPLPYRNQKIAWRLMTYAERLAINNQVFLLKADTEKKNYKMNNLFQKLGYKLIGDFKYSEYPGHYNYYEKKLKKESR